MDIFYKINRLKKTLIFSFLALLLFLTIVGVGYAQTIAPSALDDTATLGVAHIVEVKDKNVKDGSIISASKQGPVLSTVPYDPQVLGIVSRDAAIIIDSKGIVDGVPIISVGSVYLLVSTKEGPIKKGDLVTTSTIPGVAVKAIKDGYVLGTAIEDATNPNTNQVEKIAINMELHYFNAKPTLAGALSDIFKIALLPTKEGPNALFKYLVAAAVLLISIILGFMSFGRTAAKGVEALGRNPAASKTIHLGIIFNVLIVIAIVIGGIIISFLILRL